MTTLAYFYLPEGIILENFFCSLGVINGGGLFMLLRAFDQSGGFFSFFFVFIFGRVYL
jgi:hypothetical protein